MSLTPIKLIRIIDGDTIIAKRRGLRYLFLKSDDIHIRLYGIDAPESKQIGGESSTRHLKKIIGRGYTLQMKVMNNDKYGRTVALLYKGRTSKENSINCRMVRDGQARWYQAYGGASYGFKKSEEYAKKRRRGIWKNPEAQEPWNFRKGKKTIVKQKKSRRYLLWIGVALIIVVLVGLIISVIGSKYYTGI